MATGVADKLIAKTAREVLKPAGLFQKGVSRIWLDDNGWFVTQVEFQPSSWSKGAYLNVGMSFLWDQGEGFQEVLPFNVGCRELGHEEYTGNDEDFYRKMLKMAEHAKNKIEYYRRISHSSDFFKEQDSPLNVLTSWNWAMYYYLQEDERPGNDWLERLLEAAVSEREYEYEGKTCRREWVFDKIKTAEQVLSKSGAEKTDYVMRSIIEKRQRLRSKASYKKLPVHLVYQ